MPVIFQDKHPVLVDEQHRSIIGDRKEMPSIGVQWNVEVRINPGGCQEAYTNLLLIPFDEDAISIRFMGIRPVYQRRVDVPARYALEVVPKRDCQCSRPYPVVVGNRYKGTFTIETACCICRTEAISAEPRPSSSSVVRLAACISHVPEKG
jgi:hypothetical protein